MRKRNPDFAPDEDDRIAKRMEAGASFESIGTELGRSPRAIKNRFYLLRKAGLVPGYEPRRLAAMRAAPAIRDLTPPLRLRLDDDLVRYTLREGGFPRAVPTSIGTVWAAPDGMPWRHGRPVEGLSA